jgi:SnoaL-like domain
MTQAAMSSPSLLEVSARLSLNELYARYVHAIDGDDADSFADCFTDNARWVSLHSGTREGRLEIAGIVPLLGSLAPDRPMHTVSSVLVTRLDLPKASASAVATWVALYPISRRIRFGRYEDEICCDACGSWRFLSREVEETMATADTPRDMPGRALT